VPERLAGGDGPLAFGDGRDEVAEMRVERDQPAGVAEMHRHAAEPLALDDQHRPGGRGMHQRPGWSRQVHAVVETRRRVRPHRMAPAERRRDAGRAHRRQQRLGFSDSDQQ